MRRLNIRIPEDLFNRLDDLREVQGRSINDLVTRAIEITLNDHRLWMESPLVQELLDEFMQKLKSLPPEERAEIRERWKPSKWMETRLARWEEQALREDMEEMTRRLEALEGSPREQE